MPTKCHRIAPVLAAAALVASACTGDPAPPASGNPDGTSLVIAVADEPAELNPLAGYAENGAAKIFDGLVEHDADSSLRPALAADLPEPSSDGRTWTVKLRPGVTFTDGTPFEAQDVVATYRAMLAPARRSPVRQRFAMLKSVTAVDPSTVEFTLTAPYAPFPDLLVLGILPSESLAAGSTPAPVGTGPYRLTDWRHGSRMVLEANKDYWDGPPAIKKVTIEFIPDDDTRADRLREGKLDGAALPPTLAAKFANTDGLRVVSHSAADVRAVVLPAGDPVTGDPAVRLALNNAVNRTRMVKDVLAGQGSAAFTPMPRVLAEFVEPEASFDHDITRALDRLESSGWVTGPDGVRVKGRTAARFTLRYVAGDTVSADLAEAFATNARSVGIRVDVEPVSAAPKSGPMMVGFGDPFDPDLALYRLFRPAGRRAGRVRGRDRRRGPRRRPRGDRPGAAGDRVPADAARVRQRAGHGGAGRAQPHVRDARELGRLPAGGRRGRAEHELGRLVEPGEVDAAMIDLTAAQADTPACRRGVFLDSAGSSLPPVQVLDEVIGHLHREAEVGGYRAHDERLADLEAGYGVLATLLGCEPDEVAFTDSATRSWLTAFDAVPLSAGDRVLVTEVEYAGNAIPLLHRAAEVGATVEPVPSTPAGEVDVDALRAMLDERVKLVSLVHVPTNCGLVAPVEPVAAAAHEVGALVLLDACQSVGQVPVDAAALGADMISGTGRKWLRGPRGSGFLVVRREVLPRLRPRQVDLRSGTWTAPDRYELRSDARVFELWESSVADRLGLLAAARYALALGVDAIAAAVRERAEHLRAGLSALPGVTVHDQGTRRCGIVSFTVDGATPREVEAHLATRGVTVTVTDVTSTQYDMTRRALPEVVRASPHYFVSEEQLDEAVAALRT